jgi:DNA uptake protein ComE-like DNA-binding protein
MKSSIASSVLQYSKSQRIGILLFFVLMLGLQGIYYFSDFSAPVAVSTAEKAWLSQQQELDRLKRDAQKQTVTLYPFNPNFISDYKGYKLGMSVAEIDRLLAFRRQHKFVNSAAEFQAVTRVSDSLLKTIAPYFKFPDWVTHKNNKVAFGYKEFKKEEKVVVLDLNTATKEDLMKVYGIGDKISDRILAEKEKLGAFVSMDQMADVWGLSPEVIAKLNASFAIKSTANLKRINVNLASMKELAAFPFFRYALAKEMVIYRSMHGGIKTEDLSKIKGFPVDKIKIIALYLEF